MNQILVAINTRYSKIAVTQDLENVFAQRIVNSWNSLPDEVVTAKSVKEFEKLYDSANKSILYNCVFD